MNSDLMLSHSLFPFHIGRRLDYGRVTVEIFSKIASTYDKLSKIAAKVWYKYNCTKTMSGSTAIKC